MLDPQPVPGWSLSCPVMALAGQNHMNDDRNNRQNRALKVKLLVLIFSLFDLKLDRY